MITVTETMAQIAAAEKRRKQRTDREPRGGEPLTAAHAVAEGEMGAADGVQAQAAGKGYADRGAAGGPSQGLQPNEPGTITPEIFQRGYLDAGHASPSPQYEAPRVPPLPPGERGTVTQVQLPSAAVVAGSGPGVESIARFQARVGLARPVTQPPRGGE